MRGSSFTLCLVEVVHVKLLIRILALVVLVCVAGGGLAAAVPGRTFREKELWFDHVRSGGVDVLLGTCAKAAKFVSRASKTGEAQQPGGKTLAANQQMVVQKPGSAVKPADRGGQGTSGELHIVVGDEKAQAIEREVFRLLNEARKAVGSPPVEWFEPIAKMAREKSLDVFEAREMTHFSRRLGDCTDMYDRAGLRYSAADEVGVLDPECKTSVKEIAAGMIRSWLASPPHRKVILDKEFKMAGVGVAWSTAPVPVDAKVGIKSLGIVDTYAVGFILFITLAGE
jgi:uncharacterized protein YkwD